MKLKLQLIIESDTGEAEMVREVTKLERYALRPETLGLTLSEAKELLQEVQRAMVTHQTTGYVTQQTHCAKCGKIQSRKGKHEILLRTLFGKLRLDSPRLYHCGRCSKEEYRSFSPLADLLTERTAPELTYLENKFAAVISYGLTVELLAEVLPTGGDINVAGVYRNVQGVAERMEAELGEEKWQLIDGCQREWDMLPPPGPPLIVGLDGGFIYAKDQKSRDEGLVRSHRWQEHARGRRSEMLCLRAELPHKAEAAVVRIDEVTRPPGQSAGDLPVRRCGSCRCI